MNLTTLIARITIDHELKEFVPEEEVAKFIERFRGEEECETAELQKLARKPIDHESLATCFAVLQLKCASGIRHEAFYVYANGNCPVPVHDSPHLRYLFPVTADEVRHNLAFLDEDSAF
jgi:hypothetical protein